MGFSGLYRWFYLLVAIVAVAGCASSSPSSVHVKTRVDLEGFERVEEGSHGVLLAKPNVPWGGFNAVSVAPIVFDLEDKRQVAYDLRARRRRHLGLSDSDRELLRSQLFKRMMRAVEHWSDAAASRGAESLTIVPIVQRVEWTRPPVGERSLPLAVDVRSLAAGGATVGFELRRDGEEGELLAFAQESWDGNLGDGRPRVGIWSDAIEAFRIITRRFADGLEELGVGGQSRG